MIKTKHKLKSIQKIMLVTVVEKKFKQFNRYCQKNLHEQYMDNRFQSIKIKL